MKWNKTVNIKPILRPLRDKDSVSDDEAQASGKALAALLNERLPEYPNHNFDIIHNQAAFNQELDYLYDWADDNRVWLGLYTD